MHKNSGPKAFSTERKNSLGQLGLWQWAVIGLMFFVWFLKTTTTQKLISIIFSVCYSVIEFNFYRHTEDNPDGSFKWVLNNKPGFTTVEQFLMNVLYMPILTDGFRWLIPYPFARIAFSAWNVWILEIVEGTILKFLYGYNPAWDYSGKPDARFGGLIKGGHWPLWIGLGVLMELAYYVAGN